jgi:energy-converting hydrogenase Eha subunit F
MPAVDEALVVLAEIVLLAGLVALANRLWLSRPEPYPQLVAKAVNATAPYAETMIVLPQPVHLEAGYVSFRGERAAVAPLSRVEGKAYRWLLVYNTTATKLARGG